MPLSLTQLDQPERKRLRALIDVKKDTRGGERTEGKPSMRRRHGGASACGPRLLAIVLVVGSISATDAVQCAFNDITLNANADGATPDTASVNAGCVAGPSQRRGEGRGRSRACTPPLLAPPHA